MFKPSGANTGIFQDIYVNIIAVDGVAPKNTPYFTGEL